MKTEEITELEQMLDGELKCESKHLEENQVCSVMVTHLATGCDDNDLRVCAATAGWYALWMDDPLTDCDDCFRPASECWQIIPI